MTPEMTVAGVVGTLAAAGLGWIDTAVVLVCAPAGAMAAITVDDALVAWRLDAVVICGRDATAVVPLTFVAVTAEAAAVEVVEPFVEDPLRGIDAAAAELEPTADRVDVLACADEAEVAAFLPLVDLAPVDVAPVAALTEAVPFTDVSTPPEALTIPLSRSVDDPGGFDEFAESSSGDEAVFSSEGSVLDVVAEAPGACGEDPEGEDSDEDLLDDGLLGSASAMPGVLAMAKPSPSATASAPTLPIRSALPIVAP